MNKLYAKLFKTLLLTLGLIWTQTGFSQDASSKITLKGKVIDELSGEPIAGAPVFIKGTNVAAQTDLDGNFELTTDQQVPFTITLAYVGYQDKDIEIYEEDQNIEFKLRAEQAQSEVVVVGYGEQKRSDLTGSVSSIPKELRQLPVASVDRLLQGSIAGAVVTQTSGQPGGGVSVQIRGNNSILASSEPLYVIDGFPISNDSRDADAGIADGPKQNPLSNISPSDIETIDVLKDASATAIYGSRGANGVVIITTKKGTRGKASINYDGFYGVQNVIRTIPLLNAREWWQLRKDAAANTPNSKDPLSSLPAPNGWNYDTTGEGTDWQAAAFRQAAIQNHNISILSGDDKTRLAVSGNYFKQDGVLLNTDFKRYAGRINLEHNFNDKLTVQSYITGSHTKANVAPGSGIGGNSTATLITNLLFTPPAIPIYDNNGNFVRNTSTDSPLQNPINSLTNQINETNTTRLLANISAAYKILPSLTARVLVGTDIINNKQNRYLPNTTYEGNPSGGEGTGGVATSGTLNTYNWLNENTITYDQVFNDRHHINVVTGFTAQASDTRAFTASSGIFAFDDLTYNALQLGTGSRPPTSDAYAWQLASYLGRINYVLNERYLATFTFRADGSSKFGADKKWGYFPSAALGWNLHKEGFLQNFSILSTLKPRVSYGLSGNQGILPYSSISRIGAYRYNFSNANTQGYAPISAENPELGWEQTSQVNLGVDLGLLNNRFNIVFDYYNKKTTELLLNPGVPGTSGLSFYDPSLNPSQSSTVYQNIGAVRNEGIELGFNTTKNFGKAVSWNINFIFSKNTNQILSLGGQEQIIPNITLPSVMQVGAPVGSFYVYQADGVIQGNEAGPGALTPQANKSAGGQKYKDIDGDGKITQAGDRVLIKNQPGLNFGLTNTFNVTTPFGAIDITAFLQSSVGAKLYNNNRATLELGTGYYNGNAEMLNRYTSTNTNTNVKEAYQDPAVTISDRFIEDASYLRLKNLTLGLTLPQGWTSKVKLQRVRIYVSAQNLLTWTKYTGYDPEANSNGQSLIYRGIDNGVYPNSKLVQGGLNLSF